MTELKPCPFCGRVPKIEYCENWGYFIICKCGIEQSELYKQKCDAVRHWNRCKVCKHYGDKQICGRCRSRNLFCEKEEPKTEPQICDTCRYYNSNIPCGSTPSACKEADKFAEEFVDGLKKLKTEPQTEYRRVGQAIDSVTGKVLGETYDVPQTDCSWQKGE